MADEKCRLDSMISPTDICSEEWAEWYSLTPQERWRETETEVLWGIFMSLGGQLDPEPDTQSPFYDAKASSTVPPDGRPGLRVIRRSRV